MDQSQTPLVDALQHCAQRSNAAFYTPGHKRGQGTTPRQHQLFGLAAFQADLPELPELDNLFAPEGVILHAQQLAAEAFGAQQTWFLANGSTCGIEAAILATCGPGDKIIVPRNAHLSVISGLILSGAIPLYISPPYSHDWKMPIGIRPDSISAALKAHPDTKAVLLVSPTYEGLCSSIKLAAEITHKYNIPLIVDEAHGPHFAFHPSLPPTALEASADIVVQSAHKVLSAFTQASMLHVQGDRIDKNRLSQALQITQSSSPSYLLLASLDAARHQMSTEGKELLTQTIKLANKAHQALQELPGLKVLRPKNQLPKNQIPKNQNVLKHQSNNLNGDCTRLTVNVLGLGLTGFEADQILHTQYAVTAELPTLSNLTFIISIGNTEKDIDRLVRGFEGLCKSHASDSHKTSPNVLSPDFYDQWTHSSVSPEIQLPQTISVAACSPRQAFFSTKKPLSLEQAIGQVCAETLSPYPPGIPVILPGEVITESAIAQIQTTLKAGGTITGSTDPTFKTILTVTP
ncbi:MAG: aminotransferase class I/II-fold pyridoxal phosphate-dependent enzyme [Cyanobacteria bacterium J06621_11]